MVDRELIAATEAQWFQARKRMKQLGTQSAVLAVSLITFQFNRSEHAGKRAIGRLFRIRRYYHPASLEI